MTAAKNGIIDYLSSSFAGRLHPGVSKLLQIIEQEGGHHLVPIIGQGKSKHEPSCISKWIYGACTWF